MPDLLDAAASLHRSFSTRDPEQAHDYVSETFAAHRLSLADDSVRFRLDTAATDAVTVGRMAYGARARIVGPKMGDCYHINLLATGNCTVAQGDRRETFSAAENPLGVIFGPDEPVYIDWSADASQYHLKVSRHALEGHAARLLGTAPSTIDFDLSFDLGTPAGQSLNSSVAFYYSQLRPAGGLATMPAVQQELESALMTQILLVAQSNLTPELLREPSPDSDSMIRGVMDHIEGHADDDLSVASLAALVGTTPRTLQSGFRRVAGMTPTEFIRNVRLDRVRTDLVGGADVAVSDAAYRWHFVHLGRFASHYRARFGESPSQTFQRHRRGSA
ncbi:AraC family transcriptional regulator [Gordonia sp. TBRC 11910]|uniref:AraC family transcriptional regulator n=1 Tax=Gordonia asplenii TaxID=2725283 RepID=A0A848KYM0_9ACTN|nr:AraC family transcriptional regulator [Gordonia asplenii]NMO03237.1 AraC family transcriptional regulator [Gordonia asplenii]